MHKLTVSGFAKINDLIYEKSYENPLLYVLCDYMYGFLCSRLLFSLCNLDMLVVADMGCGRDFSS